MKLLPQELVDAIIDYLFDDHDTLKSCALVEKRWLKRSRYHLFFHFTLCSSSRSEDSCSSTASILLNSFMNFIESEQSCTIWISELQFGTVRHDKAAISITRSQFRKIHSIVSKLPSIRSVSLLHLAFDLKDTFPGDQPQSLLAQILQPLQRLLISECCISTSDIQRLVLLYPTKELLIDDTSFPPWQKLGDDTLPAFNHAASPGINCLHIAVQWPMETLLQLLDPSTRNLVSFTTTVSPGGRDPERVENGLRTLAHFISNRGTSLTHLRLDFHLTDLRYYSPGTA